MSVAPGDTPNVAPALTAFFTSCGVSRVPAPTTPPSTFAISEMTSKATGVRNVTSNTGRPPATNASAKGRAVAISSNTSTGITGASLQSASAFMLAASGVISLLLSERRRMHHWWQAQRFRGTHQTIRVLIQRNFGLGPLWQQVVRQNHLPVP